jgi:transcriptional regulator with XRE-family HTH domain
MDTDKPFDTFVLDEDDIANFVKLQRTFYGWKQDMLAAEAGVSLATVSRVERGQKVRPAQLRKLAHALGKPEDEFVRERVRLPPEKAVANFFEMFAWTEGRVPVKVAPFRTEIQLRAILATFSMLLDSDLGDDAADDVADLREWLSLASFVQAERWGAIGTKPDRDFRVRRLWREVLDCVERLERTHAAVVLTGTYVAESMKSGEPITIAIVAIRSRRHNPAASKIPTLWAHSKVDEEQILTDYFGELD